MYEMTLELNNKCNLKCKYCYLGEKTGIEMNKETAIKAIDIGIKEGKRHKDKKVNFDFIGGEALLNFSLLKELIEYIEEQARKENIQVIYSMTSNATLFNEEILDYLAEHKFELKVSLDGTKKANDKNRLFYDGRSSYDDVVSKMPLIKKYEEVTGDIVQVANVVTKNNYKEYSENFKHLIDLGFKFIDTGFDYYSKWTKDDFKIIEEEIYKCYEIFIEKHKNNEPFMWKFLIDAFDTLKPAVFYGCGAGIVSSYVTKEGNLFPCPTYFNKEVSVGDTENGINKEKRKWLMSIKDIENSQCNKCDIKEYCSSKSCLMMNLEVNNDINKPVPILCWLGRLQYKLIREKYDEILLLVKGENSNEKCS